MSDPAKRFSISHPVRFRLAGESRWRAGTTLNISTSGILFSTPDLPPEGGDELQIFCSDSHRPVLRIARVRVVRRVLFCWPDTEIHVGVEFLDLENQPADGALTAAD